MATELPTFVCELALGNNPGDASYSWTDVSASLRSFHIARGRQYELDQVQAGTCDIVLKNLDRRFEPGYAGVLANYNRDPSFETSLLYCSFNAANGGTLAQAMDAPSWSTGTKCAQATNPVTGAQTSWLGVGSYHADSAVPCSPGDSVYVSAAHKLVSGPGTPTAAWIVARFYNAAGAQISDVQSTVGSTGRVNTPAAGTWNKLYNTLGPAPANTAYASVFVYMATPAAPTGTYVWEIDDLLIAPVATVPDTSVYFYCDGDQDNCRWAGTANDSQSYYGGPYYPNIRPMVPVRISAIFQGVTYRLFTGYVERFPQNRTGPTYAETQIQAVDGFELLTNATLPGDTYPSELSGSRIARVLDAVNWSTTARSIATGQSTISGYTFADSDMVVPLNHIQDVELSEIGTFFITNDGQAKFQDRRSLGSVNQATFSDTPADDTGAIGYADIVVSFDKDYIVNSWTGTRDGGVTQVVIDSASISQYFLRAQSRTPLLTSDGEVKAQMEFLTANYAQPVLRAESVTITPGSNTAAWLQVLARDLTDRISVLEHPPGGGVALVQDSYIQQIDLTVPTDAANTTLVYGLLPAATNNFWQASVSKVGTDTRAGY